MGTAGDALEGMGWGYGSGEPGAGRLGRVVPPGRMEATRSCISVPVPFLSGPCELRPELSSGKGPQLSRLPSSGGDGFVAQGSVSSRLATGYLARA